MHLLRKGQMRGVEQGDVMGQVVFKTYILYNSFIIS